MRYQLRLCNGGIKAFVDRLIEVNNYLTHFPTGNGVPAKLPNKELIEIIDRAKPLAWHVAMLTANIEPSTMSLLQEVTEYFERLELLMEKLRKLATKASPSNDHFSKIYEPNFNIYHHR
jgi:hypothetical protein